MAMGMLDGKAAIVTNSGWGMGRTIALSMAAAGARVVVHGPDASLAEGVVLEIAERGGVAVACSEPAMTWEGSHDLVLTAMDHFDRVDILVNGLNANIVPEGTMISEIRREEWESVQRDYLKAAFCATRAALPYMRKQKQGRLIHFVSAEAAIGGVGYAHHGAVQMAVAGLSRNAAIEMDRYRVTSNCIVTCNGSGSVSDPADAASLAGFLASDAAHRLSGQVFGVRENEIFLFSQPRIHRSIHNSRGWTVERLSAMFESTMRRDFTPLDTGDSYFSWNLNL
jgi:NAD(P)-dependent dehydrogenase (short-subunit alcohol dehydrogenase family)